MPRHVYLYFVMLRLFLLFFKFPNWLARHNTHYLSKVINDALQRMQSQTLEHNIYIFSIFLLFLLSSFLGEMACQVYGGEFFTQCARIVPGAPSHVLGPLEANCLLNQWGPKEYMKTMHHGHLFSQKIIIQKLCVFPQRHLNNVDNHEGWYTKLMPNCWSNLYPICFKSS